MSAPATAALDAAIAAAVDARRDDAVALLDALVRVNSTNPDFPGVDRGAILGGERRCGELLAAHLERAGLTTTTVAADPERPNLVARRAGTGGGRSLALNGHLDTVPPVRRGTWRSGDPWTPVVEDGRMYALGATDMKSGLTAGWLALQALADAGVRLAGDVLVHAVVGEEQMQHELGTTAVLRAGHVADAAIVLEPTSVPRPLSVSPLSPGNWVFRIVVPGRSTHAGNRASAIWPGGEGHAIGANAVEKGVLVVLALQELERQWGLSKRHPAFPPGAFTISPGAFHADAGTPSPAYLADEATIEVLLWYPPDEDPAAVAREVEEFVLAATRLDPWLREHQPRFDWYANWPAVETPWAHPLVQAVHTAHQQATGSPAPSPETGDHVAFGAVSDASFYGLAGIASVVYGPGDIRCAHAADEHVALAEVVTAARTLALAMVAWCGLAHG